MEKEFWISWAYKNHPGHTPGSQCFDTAEARQVVMDDESLWKANCKPSHIFDTIDGEVV